MTVQPVIGKPVILTGLHSGAVQASGQVVVGKPVTVTGSDSGAKVWAGEGPPPPPIPGIAIGDVFVDTLTGNIFRLDPGE